jgi:hypothetical protein
MAVGKKLWEFIESPITGLGAGVIFGVLGVVYSLKVLFCVAGALLALSILKTNFFDGWRHKHIGTLALIAGVWAVLLVLWRVMPKPKEPPSVDEIANAVNKKIKEEQRVAQYTSDAGKTPSVSHSAPSKVDTPNQKAKSGSTPVAQNSTSGAKGSGMPEEAAPKLAALRITQKEGISSRPDAPHKTELIVQASIDFPTLKMLIECDSPILDARLHLSSGGVLMMTSQGLVKEHPNLIIFTYGSATPQFGPANPLLVDVWSQEPVTCNQVTTF